jgi:hypothetical protein
VFGGLGRAVDDPGLFLLGEAAELPALRLDGVGFSRSLDQVVGPAEPLKIGE